MFSPRKSSPLSDSIPLSFPRCLAINEAGAPDRSPDSVRRRLAQPSPEAFRRSPLHVLRASQTIGGSEDRSHYSPGVSAIAPPGAQVASPALGEMASKHMRHEAGRSWSLRWQWPIYHLCRCSAPEARGGKKHRQTRKRPRRILTTGGSFPRRGKAMSEDNSRFPAFPQKGDAGVSAVGPCVGMAGKVLSLDEGRRHARLLLTIYGRPVISEIACADIEPLPA